MENDKDDIPEIYTSCDIPTNCLYIYVIYFLWDKYSTIFRVPVLIKPCN